MNKADRQTLKELNQRIDTYIEEHDRIEQTASKIIPSSIIHLDLRNGAIYDEYSGQSQLNQGIYTYIDEAFKLIKKNTPFTIEVSYPEGMSIEEQDRIYHLLKLHYAIEYKEVKKKVFRTKAIAYILLLIGVAIYMVFGLLEWFNKNFVFRGVIEIFSWVFIWESCSHFVFTNTENKLSLLKNLAIFTVLSEK